MEYIYHTENVCAKRIKLDINGDVITNVEFLVRAAYEAEKIGKLQC